jgi:dihydroflavonol-4-reductase
MKILVTGATGFVGSVLVPELVRSVGRRALTALVLPDDPLYAVWRHKDLRIIRGNVLDAEVVQEACRGQSHVIHLAACISYCRRDKKKLLAVNRDGTANIVNACLEQGVKRLVHISTEGAVGRSRDGRPADETTPINWPNFFHYMISKLQGQQVVEEAVRRRGLEAIILNPAAIMGPGDPNENMPHNRLYRMASRGTLVGSFSGGMSVVDVRDVAAIILKALEGGRSGERYLLVGDNVTYQQAARALGRTAGQKAIPVRMPSLALEAAGILLEALSGLTGRPPLITRSYGRLSGWKIYHSNEKSIREFGHTYIDFETTVRDGYAYFKKTYLAP